MAFTVWDTVQKSAGLTLSGGNLTATGNISLNGVRAADTQTSGKFYFEITTGATYGTSQNSIGICNGNVSSSNIANSMGSTLLNVAITAKGSGNIFVNNVNSGLTIGAIAINTVVCVAVDLSAKLIWFRKGAAGSWNATSGSTNDPATGVGGASIASIAPAYQNFYPAIGFGGSGDTATANFGATGFTGSVPSGYTSGWTTGVATVSDVIVTQTGASAWVTNTHAPFNVTQVGASVWIANQVVAAYPLGVSGTGAAGTVTTTTVNAVNANITGVAGTGSAGAVSTSIVNAVDVPLTGVASTGAAGTLTVTADAAVSLTGVQATAAIGSLAIQEDASPTLTGVVSAGLAGSPSSEIDYTIATGVQVNTAIGTPSVEVTFMVGQQANAVIGVPVATVTVDIIVVGLSSIASIGDLLTFIHSGTNIILTGLSATASIGDPHIAKSYTLTGLSATASIGSPQVLAYAGSLMLDNLIVDQGLSVDVDSMVSLRWSDTSGETWGDPVHRSLGLEGDYLTSLQWQRMGMARRGRVFEISWSSPVATCLLGATVRFDAARS